MNTIYTMSSHSTTSIEDIAAVAPNTNKWFQLYVYKNRELTETLIRRVEKNGFKAIVLTVDAQVSGMRRYAIAKLPDHLQ